MTSGDRDNRATRRPARRDDVVVQELDGEAVLYDEQSGSVHRFNESALIVWKACNGHQCVAEISRVLAEQYTLASNEARTVVGKVLRDLEARGLLVDPPEQANRHVSQLPSRRELLCGGTARLIYTAPLISTFFASGACASGPSASAAFGVGGCKTAGYSCVVTGDCCAGLTCQTGTCK